MSWRVAKSLEKLRSQINTLFPERDKKSDGTIGDARHQASSSSDHNPFIKVNGIGVVRAWDCTHNLEKGVDCRLLLQALLANKDKRISYIIFERKIYNITRNFAPKDYTGANAHNHHLHISVSKDPKLFDDDSDWKLDFEVTPIISTPTFPTLRRGAKGESVRLMQQKLHIKGFLKSSEIDGDFGAKTELALQRFQLANGLVADGICGKLTWGKLG